MLMACCAEKNVLELERIRDEPLKVMWYDTEALQNEVIAISGIKQPKYYDKVFKLAVDQRIVQTTMDKHGRVVVILIPS